jgi:hypothetical protein
MKRIRDYKHLPIYEFQVGDIVRLRNKKEQLILRSTIEVSDAETGVVLETKINNSWDGCGNLVLVSGIPVFLLSCRFLPAFGVHEEIE